MSLDYAALAAVSNRIFSEPLQDYINRANPILNALEKKAVSSDRIYIKGTVSSTRGAGPVADGSAVTFAGTETSAYLSPTLDWATYIGKFSVNARAIEQMAHNPGQLGMLLETEIMNASKDLADALAADIFEGTVTNGLVGLATMIDSANTYAGVDRSEAANANFRSPVVDHTDGEATPAGQELSTTVLNAADSAYFAANGYGFTDRPGLFTGVTDALIYNKYRALMETIDLSALSAAHFVNRANSTGQLGYGNIGYSGVPFIRDRNVINGATDLENTSRLYILDMSKIHLCTLDANSEMSMIQQQQGYTVAPTADGIKATVEFLGKSGETVQGYVKAYVQLATPDPKCAGVLIKNISND